jgi:hypothetical protein
MSLVNGISISNLPDNFCDYERREGDEYRIAKNAVNSRKQNSFLFSDFNRKSAIAKSFPASFALLR